MAYSFMISLITLWYVFSSHGCMIDVLQWLIYSRVKTSWEILGAMTIYQPSSPTDFHIFQRGWNHQPDMYIYIYTCSIVMLNYQRVSDITLWYDCELATFQAASCPSCETMWNTASCLPPRWVRTVCWRRPNTPRGIPTWRRTDPSHPDGAEWCWVFSMIPEFCWEIWNQNPIF